MIAGDPRIAQRQEGLPVPLLIHAHERGELHETGIHPPAGPRAGRRHRADQVALEPRDGVLLGHLIDPGRALAGIDRTGHQHQAGRLAIILIGRHQRGRGQAGHGRLADPHQMGGRPQGLQETDQVQHILVEAEPAAGRRNVAGVDPVGETDLMVLQQGAQGARQQGREVPRHRRHQQHPGLVAGTDLAKAQQTAERGLVDRVDEDGPGLAAGIGHRRQREIRPGVGQAQQRHHLQVGRELPPRGRAGQERRAADELGAKGSPLPQKVALAGEGVVGGVDHGQRASRKRTRARRSVHHLVARNLRRAADQSLREPNRA